MRTLKDEVLYLREKGFYRNDVELATMLSWLGEQITIEAERDAAINGAAAAVLAEREKSEAMRAALVAARDAWGQPEFPSVLVEAAIRAEPKEQQP